MLFIHQYPDWTHFHFDNSRVLNALAKVRYKQGMFCGKMFFAFEESLAKECRTKEWEILLGIDGIQGNIRSAISKRLENLESPLDAKEICRLHGALGYSGFFREDSSCGVLWHNKQNEEVYFSGLAPEKLSAELSQFFEFFNTSKIDPLLVAAISHFWFLTLRPFHKGNGCIARMILDLGISKSENSPWRFYSVFEEFEKNQTEYYNVLQRTWLGRGDITEWLLWLLKQIENALVIAETKWKNKLVDVSRKMRYGELSFSKRELALLEYLKNEVSEISSSSWADNRGVSHDSALRDFKSLMEKGILEKSPQTKGRNTKYRIKQDI